MKKLIILVITTICLLSSSAQAQTKHNWQILHTGYIINENVSKLVVTKNCLYICKNSYSTLLRSVNRGATWDSIHIPFLNEEHDYSDITFVNDSVGYIAGYEGDHHGEFQSAVKRTTNKGLTWQTILPQMVNLTAFMHINFFNAEKGMVFGSGTSKTERFQTADGGLNWTYLPNEGPLTSLVRHSWLKDKDGFVTGFWSHLLIEVTHDYGNTWNAKKFPGIPQASGLKFFDNQTGVVVAEDSIYFTTDGADSFSSKAKFPYANVVRSFDMLDMKRGFFCTGQSIYYTADAGKNWILSYTNPNTNIGDLKIEGNDAFVSIFNDSIILKLDISDLTSGLHEIKPKRNLLQIYPNPSTDNIYIANLENEKLLTATITDQLGKTVRKQSLLETRTIDIKGLDYGIYIITVNAENETYINKLVIDKR